jgi:hypothetical protein
MISLAVKELTRKKEKEGRERKEREEVKTERMED